MSGKLNIFITVVYLAFITWIITDQWIESAALMYSICVAVPLVSAYLLYGKIKNIRFSSYFLIASFILVIAVPFVGPKETESLEKRELAPYPKFRVSNVWKFLKEYKKYFEDRFAYRNLMMEIIARVKLEVWSLSPIPDKVEVGHDYWLYSSGDYYAELISTPFSENELKLIKANLEIITLWLEEKNIRFYYLCAPVKARIYPDKMPEALRRLNAFSRLGQVYSYLEGNEIIKFIDVRDELIEGRKTRDTYLKTDTHWNEFGAFLAYRKIMQTMQKDIPDLQFHDLNAYQIDSSMSDEGDLLQVMGIEHAFPYTYYKFTLKSGQEAVPVDSTHAGEFMRQTVVRSLPGSINNRRIYINRDSMTEYLKIFFSTSFDYTCYYWKPYLNVSLALQQNPDIIFHEMQEIFINHTLKLPPEIKADTTFVNKYYPNYSEIENAVDFSRIVLF